MTVKPLLIGLIAGTALAASMPGTSHAATRDADLISSFEQLCTKATPDLTQIDQKAQAMRLASDQNVSQPSQGSGTTVARTWKGNLQSGPIQLMGTDTTDQRGHVVTCGLSASDASGPAFQQELVTALNLGNPVSTSPVPGGQMVMTTWNDVNGPGTMVQLMQSAQGSPGIMVNYAVKGQ